MSGEGARLAARAAAVMGAAALATPLIAQFEGYEPVGYADPAPGRFETVCFGHRQDGVLGKRFSDEACLKMLADDAVRHGLAIDGCLEGVDLAPETRAAFTAFAFNVGAEKFCVSTLAAKVRAGDLAGACAELSRWTLAGGKPLPGLIRRRAAERALCEKGLRK
jgi:lysozyme